MIMIDSASNPLDDAVDSPKVNNSAKTSIPGLKQNFNNDELSSDALSMLMTPREGHFRVTGDPCSRCSSPNSPENYFPVSHY